MSSNNRYLVPDIIREIHRVAIECGLADQRKLLVDSDPTLLSFLPKVESGRPSAQLLSDLQSLNQWGDPAAAEHPMRGWLLNAEQLTEPHPASQLFGAWARREAAVLDTWRNYLVDSYARLNTFFPHVPLSGHIHDAVDLDWGLWTGGDEALSTVSRETKSLRSILLERRDPAMSHMAILGGPGTGKSTLARAMARLLASESETVPIPVSMPDIVESRRNPIECAIDAIGPIVGRNATKALERDLRQRMKRTDAVCLLVDSIDEITGSAAREVEVVLGRWAEAWPSVQIVLFTRIAGYGKALRSRFLPFTIRPLDVAAQGKFLRSCLPDPLSEKLTRLIRTDRGFAQLAENPLLLSLTAYVAHLFEGSAEPPRREALFHHAIDGLLTDGRDHRGGVRSPSLARATLAHLADTLVDRGGTGWSMVWTTQTIDRIWSADRPLGRECREVWATAGAFVDDLEVNSGLMSRLEGPEGPLRFLHKGLLDRLAAERLVIDANRRTTVLSACNEDPATLDAWVGALGFASARVDDPERMIAHVVGAAPQLLIGLLSQAETIPLTACLELIESTPGARWDGDTLLTLSTGRVSVHEALWRRVLPHVTLSELAWLHYALSAVDGPVSRERFFTACDRWPAGDPTELEWVSFEPGDFTMGTPPEAIERMAQAWRRSKARRFERPFVAALQTAFEISTHPVTLDAYRAFDPHHQQWGGGRVPVTGVSWWHARLFAAWSGCRLPTEAEWESACRESLPRGRIEIDSIWHLDNSRGRPTPVGETRRSPNRPSDMLGNVWEWCADWYAPYPAARTTDPCGPNAGTLRVKRGGSFRCSVHQLGPSERGAAPPGFTADDTGFRLVRSGPNEEAP